MAARLSEGDTVELTAEIFELIKRDIRHLKLLLALKVALNLEILWSL
jgi:hypothetical protein